VTGTLLRKPGTLVVEHRFDGHVVKRTVRNLQDGINLQDGVLVTAETALELAHGCIVCTIRDDLLILLRKLHRRADVALAGARADLLGDQLRARQRRPRVRRRACGA
jgi:hypothetical protein